MENKLLGHHSSCWATCHFRQDFFLGHFFLDWSKKGGGPKNCLLHVSCLLSLVRAHVCLVRIVLCCLGLSCSLCVLACLVLSVRVGVTAYRWKAPYEGYLRELVFSFCLSCLSLVSLSCLSLLSLSFPCLFSLLSLSCLSLVSLLSLSCLSLITL